MWRDILFRGGPYGPDNPHPLDMFGEAMSARGYYDYLDGDDYELAGEEETRVRKNYYNVGPGMFRLPFGPRSFSFID